MKLIIFIILLFCSYSIYGQESQALSLENSESPWLLQASNSFVSGYNGNDFYLFWFDYQTNLEIKRHVVGQKRVKLNAGIELGYSLGFGYKSCSINGQLEYILKPNKWSLILDNYTPIFYDKVDFYDYYSKRFNQTYLGGKFQTKHLIFGLQVGASIEKYNAPFYYNYSGVPSEWKLIPAAKVAVGYKFNRKNRDKR